MVDASKNLRRWENGLNKWDLQEESRKQNNFLELFGRDQYTFEPENRTMRNLHLMENEALHAHGYPYTTYLQLGLCYGCAVYTAQEQGVFQRRQIIGKFWNHHYFDWILAAKRSGKYGVVGGFLLGTFLFGDVSLSIRRVFNRYNYFLAGSVEDPLANVSNYHTKFNN